MDSASGRITGTPGLPGNYSFTAEVRDSGPTQQQEATENLTVSIQLVPLTITTPDLPAGVLNAPYSLQMRASGGIPPYYWSVVSGTLPPGLELDPTTGRLTGIPIGAGTFSFTIQVMDSNTPQSFARIFVGPPGRSPG